jgi:hypothetical protein
MSNIANATSELMLDFHLRKFKEKFGDDKAARLQQHGKLNFLCFLRLTEFLGPGETTFGGWTNNLSEVTNGADTLSRKKDVVSAMLTLGQRIESSITRMHLAAVSEYRKGRQVTAHALAETEALALKINKEGWRATSITGIQIIPFPKVQMTLKRHDDAHGLNTVTILLSENHAFDFWYERAGRTDFSCRSKLRGMPDSYAAYALVYLDRLVTDWYSDNRVPIPNRIDTHTLCKFLNHRRSVFYSDLFHVRNHMQATEGSTNVFTSFSFEAAEGHRCFLPNAQYTQQKNRKRYEKGENEQSRRVKQSAHAAARQERQAQRIIGSAAAAAAAAVHSPAVQEERPLDDTELQTLSALLQQAQADDGAAATAAEGGAVDSGAIVGGGGGGGDSGNNGLADQLTESIKRAARRKASEGVSSATEREKSPQQRKKDAAAAAAATAAPVPDIPAPYPLPKGSLLGTGEMDLCNVPRVGTQLGDVQGAKYCIGVCTCITVWFISGEQAPPLHG